MNQMIKVYHAKVPTFFEDEAPSFNEDNFKLIAEVDTDDLDEAYELTNTINQEWHLNGGVKLIGAMGCRSTSIGDVLIANSGRCYRVESVGFKEI
jgi:hypothetical protein